MSRSFKRASRVAMLATSLCCCRRIDQTAVEPVAVADLSFDDQAGNTFTSTVSGIDQYCRQHLYRVHQRPENHCIRCFEVFNSSQLLDQHAQQSVSCSTKTCPFSEKFTSGQMTELKRKWIGRSAEECWYTIFRILFPQGQAPTSPCKTLFKIVNGMNPKTR